MHSSLLIMCFLAFTLIVIICCTQSAFNVRMRPNTPREATSHLIDLHAAPPRLTCKNYRTLLINISTTALLDATLSKLHPRLAVLLVSPPQLAIDASTLRTAARAGHTLVLQHDLNTRAEMEGALFESLLGFPPIFYTGMQNTSGIFTLVGLDNPAQVLVDSAVVRWAQDTPVCDGDVGLVGRLDSAQLALTHERLNCDFVTPGEVMWRFCKNVRAEFEQRRGSMLGKYASRRDQSADVDDMRGIVARNRKRVTLARELATKGVEDALFVLYAMSEREVEDRFRGTGNAVVRWERIRAVRRLVGVICLVVGVVGMVHNVWSTWRRRSWRLMAKAADFGKIV